MTRSKPSETRPTKLARLFPWTRLFRGPAIALDTRKLLLASFGLILAWAGRAGLDRLFGYEGKDLNLLEPARLLGPSPSFGVWFQFTNSVAEPFILLIEPFVRVFRIDQSFVSLVHALLTAIWLVIVWGTIGGAIARIAAIQQATGRRIGLVSAIRFATSRLIPLVGAPLSPLIGIVFFAAICFPIGLLYRIPTSLGATLAGLLGFLPLLAGLVMALILAGLAVGWPLMTATVAVEAEDAFDALSRSYSYVTQRPGHYGVYALISWIVGAIGFVVVTLLSALVIHMAVWSLSFGGQQTQITGLFAGDQQLGKAPAAIHTFWIALIHLLTHSWVYSYFFTAATLIFVLLRKDVDGAPYHDFGGNSSDNEPFAGLVDSKSVAAIETPKTVGDEVG